MDEIQANGHGAFHEELTELLWFGGIVSYGNVMAETYAIMYDWIKPVDLPDLEGLCECNDGITFRAVIINSLRLVRSNHTQQIIDNWYTKLDNAKVIMCPGGLTGFFSRLKQYKVKLKNAGETITDAYLIRRTTMAVRGKHELLQKAVKDLRQEAGRSGTPTTYSKLKNVLLDTFQYEIPDADKQEKPPEVKANFAGDDANKRGPNKEDGEQNPKKKRRWRRPVFPKGSCKNCPNATDHTTERCWRAAGEKKGLPDDFQ